MERLKSSQIYLAYTKLKKEHYPEDLILKLLCNQYYSRESVMVLQAVKDSIKIGELIHHVV